MGISVNIFAFGNRTRYAPRIPDTAPEAPIATIFGLTEVIENSREPNIPDRK